MRSLEFASDLMVLRGQCKVISYPDRVVQISPDQPDFWFGNRVFFRDPPQNADALIAQFHADFPQAAHICLSWDIPNLLLADVARVFDGTGLTVEAAETLALSGEVNRAAAPKGMSLRAFETDEDWRQSEAIAMRQHIDDGLPEAGLATYLSGQTAVRKTQIAKGFGQWFGAFDGGRLAGDMGVFFDDRVIRYQSVQTGAAYRRRGVCSALLCHALDWARTRAPRARPVIVAESDSDAGRLYRRAGFAVMETTISAYRPPQNTG